MEVDRDVAGFLQKQRQSAPENLKDYFNKFEDMYEKKLWHQLTLAIEEFVLIPASGPYLVPLYEHFILDWEKKMNQLGLVKYVTKACKQYKDPKQSLEFLLKQVEKLKTNKSSRDAYVLATMEAAHYKLITSDLEGCKKAIDECEKMIEELTGVETVINACFYRVAADYYKAKAAYPQYYHNALLFLSSITLEELSPQEQIERAHDLALSALLGDGLYNFGELLMHPILDSLKKTPFEYLRNILFQFNSGDMDGFNKVKHSAEFQKQPLLNAALPFLNQKLCLMTLIESVFKRTKEARGFIAFHEFAHECRVGLDEVEHLVMKALSLGLIKGKIDEVNGAVQITWVQPRVLDKSQIKTLTDTLNSWLAKVKDQVSALEGVEGSRDIFIH